MKKSLKSNVPYGPSQLPWDEQVPEGVDVTGPEDDPIAVYPVVPPKEVKGDFPCIDYRKFEIPPGGLSEEEYVAAIEELKKFILTQHENFTGFQTNEYFENNAPFDWMLNIHTNNVGDPFQSGIFTLNTKFCERSVLDYFASIWRA